jgi:hypothetical protein
MMPTPPNESHRDYLEANADKPEVQEEIRLEIRAGTIRVIPWPGRPDWIRIVPVRSGGSESTETPNNA